VQCWWLGSLVVGRRTDDSRIVSSISGRLTIGQLVLGGVTVFERAYHLGMLRVTQANSAYYLCVTGNEFRSNCGDALRLGIEGRMANSIRG